MNLIDRYVHAVGSYLPKEIRDDVLKELRTNIEDMLPDNYTEKDIYNILKEMGSPMELANEYNPQKRYIIGPGYYDKYLEVLKIVVGICIAVFIGIEIIERVINPSKIDVMETIIQLFINIISGGLLGAMQGAFWVTLIFVILERSGVEAGDLSQISDKWTPDSLPELPVNDGLKISRGETIFSVVWTIIFTALLYFQPQVIGIYRNIENGVLQATPLFDINVLKVYMPFILALTVLQLGIFIWKYIAERWNISLIICNAVYNVLMCILVVVMLSDTALFNAAFISEIAELTKGSINTIALWFDRGKWIFAGVFIVLCIWDSISTFYKFIVKK
ncbi:HAAS signaling domain-containing protein [Alloiococcus sp. CFN-8]|uniref:HAAS signaling domain-containing protein n=1 Tax=Alloiococcus sp. CFN-8 TaxID=3416081 RepID=UPI003CF55077